MASTFTAAGPPPDGSTPGTGLPTDSLDAEIVATAVLSIVFTTFFTAARLIAKRSLGSFMIEDYFSLTTWVIFMGYVATVIVQMNVGIGKHIWNVPASSGVSISKISWAIELLYCVLTWLAKAALLFQLQRIFAPRRSGTVYIACQVLIWINLAFYGSAFISVAVECVPLQGAWNTNVKNAVCIDIGALLISMGAINILSDCMILVLPIWAIAHLQTSTKNKLGVSAVFATGLLAIACSICRLVYTIPPLHSEDTTYLFAPVALWSLAEISSIILCTCFPMMPRFVRIITNKDERQAQYSKQSARSETVHGVSGRNEHYANCKRGSTGPLYESESKIIDEHGDEDPYCIRQVISIEMVSQHDTEKSDA